MEDECMCTWDLQDTQIHRSLSQFLWDLQPYLKQYLFHYHCCQTVLALVDNRDTWESEYSQVFDVGILAMMQWGFITTCFGWQAGTSIVIIINRMQIVGLCFIYIPSKAWSWLVKCEWKQDCPHSSACNFDPCSLEEHVYNSSLEGLVKCKISFWNRSNESAAVILPLHMLVTGAVTCRTHWFSVIRMVPVMMLAGTPQDAKSILFTMAKEIFVLHLFWWLIAVIRRFVHGAWMQCYIYWHYPSLGLLPYTPIFLCLILVSFTMGFHEHVRFESR